LEVGHCKVGLDDPRARVIMFDLELGIFFVLYFWGTLPVLQSWFFGSAGPGGRKGVSKKWGVWEAF